MREALRRERGAAAVEFALILPILLLLVMGTIDFARAYNTHISLSGGAREGARAFALGTGDVETITRDAAPSVNPSADITVSCAIDGTGVACTDPCSTGKAGEVAASYPFEYITPISNLMQLFGGSALASPVTITGIGVMRCGG